MQQNLGKMLKGIAELQRRMEAVQKDISSAVVTGEAANGLVKVTMTGKGEVTRIEIDPSIMTEDADMVADLVTAAHANAFAAKEALSKDKLSGISTGLMPLGMKIPGLG